jgi:hypothetical protein
MMCNAEPKRMLITGCEVPSHLLQHTVEMPSADRQQQQLTKLPDSDTACMRPIDCHASCCSALELVPPGGSKPSHKRSTHTSAKQSVRSAPYGLGCKYTATHSDLVRLKRRGHY